MKRPLLVFGTLLFGASTACGQSAPSSDQTEQVRMLLERIEKLERRVTELESKQAATPPPLSAATTAPVQPPSTQESTAPPVQAHQHDVQERQAAVQQRDNQRLQSRPTGFTSGVGTVQKSQLFRRTDLQRATNGIHSGSGTLDRPLRLQ